MLVKAGSGILTAILPRFGRSSGVSCPEDARPPYNDIDAVRDLFRREGQSIAAVIVEPVAANMGRRRSARGVPRRAKDSHDGEQRTPNF